MLLAENLTKKYGHYTALDNLTLSVKQGEIFCLLGANGAGKTTTVNLFMGFIEPTSGKVYINDTEVKMNNNSTRKMVAYIPENVMLYPELTGIQNLKYLSSLSGKKYSDSELKDFLLGVDLTLNAITQKVSEYSKGMRQKVGIALALAKEASVLFLDEPTSGLDPLASNEFSNVLKWLSHKNVSILMVTHDLFRAKEVANRIGIMKEGKMIKVLNAADVNHTELENIYMNLIAGKKEE